MEREKIKSPKTNRSIYINGDAYNNLIKDGYTTKYLLSLPRIRDKNTIKTHNKINILSELHDVILSNVDIKEKILLYYTSQYYHQLYKKEIKDYLKDLIDTLSALSTIYHDKYKLNWDYEKYYRYNQNIYNYFVKKGFILNKVDKNEFYITENNDSIVINLSKMIVPFDNVVITRRSDKKQIIIKNNQITVNDILSVTLQFWGKVYYKTIGYTEDDLNTYQIDHFDYNTLYLIYNNRFT